MDGKLVIFSNCTSQIELHNLVKCHPHKSFVAPDILDMYLVAGSVHNYVIYLLHTRHRENFRTRLNTTKALILGLAEQQVGRCEHR